MTVSLEIMVRQLGIQYPGALYHVTARGDRREDIVHDDADREMLIEDSPKGLGLLDYRWSRLAQGYALPPRKRSKWLRAEEGLAMFDLPDSGGIPNDSRQRPEEGRHRKVAHERTAVTRRWTAGRLKMKSAVNVCQQFKRLKTGKLNLTKEAKQWLSAIEP